MILILTVLHDRVGNLTTIKITKYIDISSSTIDSWDNLIGRRKVNLMGFFLILHSICVNTSILQSNSHCPYNHTIEVIHLLFMSKFDFSHYLLKHFIALRTLCLFHVVYVSTMHVTCVTSRSVYMI